MTPTEIPEGSNLKYEKSGWRSQIREVFLRNGFTIKPGCEDLRDYVYKAAFELLELAAPAVQGEPVAWSGCGCQYPGKMPRLYGDRRIAELNCDRENGDQVLYFTAAPQPVEQQPTPDESALVELLAEARDHVVSSTQPVRGGFIDEIDTAIAAHRKGDRP